MQKIWLAVSLIVAFVYALPNLYGEDYAVQLRPKKLEEGFPFQPEELGALLAEVGIQPLAMEQGVETWLVRLKTADMQLRAKDLLQRRFPDISVALQLAAKTPAWLQVLGAKPMRLGLDLRGGVHFLLEADLVAATKKFEGDAEAVSDEAKYRFQNEVVDHTVHALHKRVNELGVAEALVQRQGSSRIVVELPGVQDTAYAKEILGKTATLKFLLHDPTIDPGTLFAGARAKKSSLYFDQQGRSVVLKNDAVLTGESITYATTGLDRDGLPAVDIRIGGDVDNFIQQTSRNVGNKMAVVYVEAIDGKTSETVISLATIHGPLGHNFQISGLSGQQAKDLALMLRAGALPAALKIVEESVVGPSLGIENINKGVTSIVVGFAAVLIFMVAYYNIFGLVANVTLFMNLILIVALMSIMGATLTLPGMAGIVLTLGMAVDANVLMFERIREEINLGFSPKASIKRGLSNTFATIMDSNLTTLIAGLALFSIGSGPVKGFAVTLCLGILTTLLSALTGTKILVNWFFLSKGTLKHVPVGI